MADASENKEAQDEEIESLQSIYLPEELVVTQRDDGRWEILAMVSVPVPENYEIKYSSNEEPERVPCILRVQHLPPIQLRITYKTNYPSKSPPFLNISCVWLTPAEQRILYSFLMREWTQNVGFPVVYNWIDTLQSEALKILGKTSEINLMHAKTEKSSPSPEDLSEPGGSTAGRHFSRTTRKSRLPITIVQFLDAYNIEKSRDEFQKSFVQCEICFNKKLGKDSVQFKPCLHVYCRECLTGYFTILVNDGSSTSVKCPGFKCESEATQTQVREVLPAELFDKYDRALLSTMLDTMSDIVYCPRPLCNYPVSWSPEEKVAICPSCRYAFCIYCRMVYHGVEPCRLNADARRKLVEDYQTADSSEKKNMEARYGKKQIENLVSNTLSEYWIKDNSKHCPKCNIVIEKTDGCNKMTCFRCHAFFCWLCGAHLDPKIPYLHFQDPKSKCNNLLFQFEGGEPDDWEWEDWVGDDSDSEDIEGADSDTESDDHPLS